MNTPQNDLTWQRGMLVLLALLISWGAAWGNIQVQTLDLVGADNQTDTLEVQTDFYKVRFNLLETGSVVSLHSKPLDLELRAEDYYTTRNNLFRDWVRLAEPDAETGLTRAFGNNETRAPDKPCTYKILKQTAQELVLEFERSTVTPENGPAWMNKLVQRRRVTLRQDSPTILVEVEVFNGDNRPRQVLVDVYNGMALGRIETIIHLPAAEGKMTGVDQAAERGSRTLYAPEIAGAWMGGVNDQGQGAAFSFDWPVLDSLYAEMWKTVGTGYIACMRRMEIPAGGKQIYTYRFLPFTGFEALDGMTGDLAGGITVGAKTSHVREVVQSELLANATVPVKVKLASGTTRQVNVTLQAVRKEDGSVALKDSRKLDLKAGQTQALEAALKLGDQGLYVLTVTADDGAGTVLRLEKPLNVGRTKLAWAPTPPEGKKLGIRDAGDSLGPAAMDPAFKTVDRTFTTPHESLVKPDAGGPVKAFFLMSADHSLGHIRELAQRVDMEYDYHAMGKIASPPGDLNFRDVMTFRKKLPTVDATALVSLGVEWEAGLKREASREILDRVRDGMGLVVQVSELEKQPELFNALTEEGKEIKDLILPASAAALPPVRYFTLGKGRVAVVLARINVYRDGAEAAFGQWTSLKIGEQTAAIPDIRWRGFEYGYARFGQLIRWAGGKDTPLVITDATVEGQQVNVKLNLAGNPPADGAATLSVNVRGPRWQSWAKGTQSLQLSAGASQQAVKLDHPLPNGPVALEMTLRDRQNKVLAFASAGALVKSSDAAITIVPNSDYQRVGALESARVEVTGGQAGSMLKLRLEDRHGRILLQQSHQPEFTDGKASVELKLGTLEPVTIYHEVVAQLWQPGAAPQSEKLLAEAATPIFLLPTKPDYADRFVLAMADPPGRQARHLQGALPTARKLGITMHNHAYDDKVLYFSGGIKAASVSLTPTATGRYAVDPKLKQTLDGKNNIMNPPLLPDEAAVKATQERWMTGAKKAYNTGAFMVMIDDERRMSGDFDRSPQTMAGFRKWIRERYPDIAALNRAWGSKFSDFEQVTPALREQVIETDNLAPWLEFRMYIGQVIGEYFMQKPAEWAAQISPDYTAGEYGIYDPSYVWPVDWSQYAHFYKHTQRYGASQGPLEKIFQSFAPQTNHGIWTGYGMRKISSGARLAPWRSLLSGGHFAWYWAMEDYGWWNYAVTSADQRPTPGYAALSREEWPDIQGGIDRLIIASRMSPDGIALAYSYPSWVADASALAVSSKRIVEQMGLQNLYVNLQDLPQGALQKGNYKLLLIQQASCISAPQAQAIEKFIQAGGVVLAVGRNGWRDLNGSPHAQGSVIDKITGVDLTKTKVVDRLVEVTYKKQPSQIHLNLLGSAVKEAQVLTAVKVEGQADEPLLTVRSIGQGKIFWLNSSLAGHDVLRANDDVDPDTLDAPPLASVAVTHWRIFDDILAAANVKPRMQLLRAKRPIYDSETFYYLSPSGRSLFVARNLGRQNEQPVTVSLAKPAMVYDMREGKLIGANVDRFEQAFPTGRMQVFALLDYTVKGLSAQVTAAQIKPGQTALVNCRVVTDGHPADLHAYRYQVLDSQGRPMEIYQGTVLAANGQAAIRIPTALNDPAGTYTVKITDALSGQQAQASFQIAP